jgi:hypothetical protein
MISILKFKKETPIGTLLVNYTDIYAIESMVQCGLIYGIADGKFAILRAKGAIYCPLHETPNLAERFLPLKDEIMEIYHDIKDRKEFSRWIQD